jgi:multidrug efflux pump subunit AcrB
LLRDVDPGEIRRAYRLIEAKTAREASVLDVAGVPRSAPRPSLAIDIDGDLAARMGFDLQRLDAVAGMVEAQASTGAFELGTIRGNRGQVQVFLRYGEDAALMEMVQQTTVRGPNGNVVPLTQLAQVRLTQKAPVMNLHPPVVVTLTPVDSGGDELHKWVVEELVPALENAVPPARGHVERL